MRYLVGNRIIDDDDITEGEMEDDEREARWQYIISRLTIQRNSAEYALERQGNVHGARERAIILRARLDLARAYAGRGCIPPRKPNL